MFEIRDLINAFREDSLMTGILADFSTMIEDAQWMFEASGVGLLEGGDPQANRQAIYDRDININKAERSIRKRIIKHLALNPGKDLGTCLVLFSAVKDAERLGDYCKNLQELADFIHGTTYPEKWGEAVRDLHGRILELFPLTAVAFKEADEAGARDVIERVSVMGKECDSIVESIVKSDENQEARGAVATTLTVRYFKRTASHIGNIATGLVNPVHKIDFNK